MTSSSKKSLAGIVIVAALAAGVVYASRDLLLPLFFAPTPPAPSTAPGVSLPEAGANDVTVLLHDLHVPWETASLPDGSLLVTERNGTLLWHQADGMDKAFKVDGVTEYGEGGLLGMALAPDFETSKHLYLYSTTRVGSAYSNRVIRYTLGDALTEPTVIIDKIPGAIYHDGGRIAFGPDGKLYVTTGDATNSANAQNKDSLGGKILRVNPDGSIPSDNPFGNATWSYGHRNPQGIAWDDQGRLWATEHGRSGVASGYDELNLIVKGGNYGWPLIQGDETRDGLISPVRQSGANDTWAPSGIAFADGALFFGGLRGTSLYEARVDASGTVTKFQGHFRRDFGRLRDVRVAGKFLYVTTSNDDGRGTKMNGDDKVLRVRIDSLK